MGKVCIVIICSKVQSAYYIQGVTRQLKSINGRAKSRRPRDYTYVAGDECSELAMVPLDLRKVHWGDTQHVNTVGLYTGPGDFIPGRGTLYQPGQFCTRLLVEQAHLEKGFCQR